MGKEWNDCVSFHFLYHCFNRPILWNRTVLFEAFRSECKPLAFHFGTLWNKVERLRSRVNGASLPEKNRLKTLIKNPLFIFYRKRGYSRMNRFMSPHRSNMTLRVKEILVLLQVEHKLVTVEKNNLKKLLSIGLKTPVGKHLNDCLGNEDSIANVSLIFLGFSGNQINLF